MLRDDQHNTEVSEPVIRFRDVHVAYPNSEEEALRGVTLSITAGQHVCILGSNGSGKSTLLQLINALELPSAGAVEVFSLNTLDAANVLEIRKRAAAVFQQPEDQMVASVVADDVAFGPENLCVAQPEIARRVDAALAAIGMSEAADKDPAELSGGQQQRVAIAGALAMQPRILLLDEPCAMLDELGRREVMQTIRQLNDFGITIVHVTHFMDDVRLANRAIVLHKGTIAFNGTPAELFSNVERLHALGLELPRSFNAHGTQTHQGVGANLPSNQPNAHGEGTSQEQDDLLQFSQTPSIIFENVSYSYGATKATDTSSDLALNNLSFSAKPGTITAFVGQTGSGKSTTVQLACALKMPTSGRVVVAGVDTTDRAHRRKLRRRVGYVAQLPERQLFAETIYDDVAFGPRNLGVRERDVSYLVHKALETVGLKPNNNLLRRSPFTLSGGQQRSVALAGVLAMNQPILVLDEPMAGLDPQGRQRIRALLMQLKRRGTTLLMVTHSIDDMFELADQVVVLDHGTCLGTGAPRDVLPLLQSLGTNSEVEGGLHLGN